jgi:hypothetical protein
MRQLLILLFLCLVTLASGAMAQTQLINGVPFGGLAGSTGNQKLFVLSVPSNAGSLAVSTSCGDPDADVYVKWGSPPTTSSWHFKSDMPGSNESISIGNPAGGNLYILVHAHSSYSGLAIVAQYNGGDNVDVEELDNGDTLTGIDGFTGDSHYFKVSLPANQDMVKVTLTGGDPDADLYVRWDDLPTTTQYTKKSTTSTSNESVTITDPGSGDLYILVHGFATYFNASLHVEWEGPGGSGTPIELTNGIAAGGFSGGNGSSRLFTIDLPVGTTTATFMTYGGNGDADLYVRWDQPPTVNAWDERSNNDGNGESITVASPDAGTVYLLVYGYDPYANLKIKVSYQAWKHYSHLSAPWKNQKMGSSNVKIKNGGAALASLAMALQFAGSEVDPGSLNAFLKSHDGYTQGSIVKWSAAAAFDGAQGLTYEGPDKLTTLAKLRQLLDSGHVVLARSNRYDTDSHWVVIRYYTGTGNTWSKFHYWDPADQSPGTDRKLGDGWVDSGAKTRVFQID